MALFLSISAKFGDFGVLFKRYFLILEEKSACTVQLKLRYPRPATISPLASAVPVMYILKSIAKAADFPLQAKLHSTLHASQLHDTHGFNSRKHNIRCLGTFETHVAVSFKDISRQEQ